MKRVRAVVVLSLVYAAVFVVVQGAINFCLHYWLPNEFPVLGDFLSWGRSGAAKAAIFGFLMGVQVLSQVAGTARVKGGTLTARSLMIRGTLLGALVGLLSVNSMRMIATAPHTMFRYALTFGTYVTVAAISTAIITWFGIPPRTTDKLFAEGDAGRTVSARRELVLGDGVGSEGTIEVRLVPKRLWAWLTKPRSD